MKNPLKSRKFLLAVATAISLAASDLAGVDLQPEAIVGAVALILGWIGVEGFIDREGVKQNVEIAKNEGIQDMLRYITQLEAQLASIAQASGMASVASGLDPVDAGPGVASNQYGGGSEFPYQSVQHGRRAGGQLPNLGAANGGNAGGAYGEMPRMGAQGMQGGRIGVGMGGGGGSGAPQYGRRR